MSSRPDNTTSKNLVKKFLAQSFVYPFVCKSRYERNNFCIAMPMDNRNLLSCQNITKLMLLIAEHVHVFFKTFSHFLFLHFIF